MCHGLYCGSFDQGDHAAAEATSRHPCAVRAGGQRTLYCDVELCDRHLEIVSQGAVRGGQSGADLPRVGPTSTKQVYHVEDAGVLGHDMPDPAA